MCVIIVGVGEYLHEEGDGDEAERGEDREKGLHEVGQQEAIRVR